MEQYNHCVFVASNYTNKKRKGLHFLYNDKNFDAICNVINEYGKKDGISVYFLNTNSVSIESLQKKDGFFKDMIITEGTVHKEFVEFFKSINNQVSAFDVALLFLTRNRLTFEILDLMMFHYYCLYTKSNNQFPFKEKLSFENGSVSIKRLKADFKDVDNDDVLTCNKQEVVFSKFINCDNGFQLMNESLRIFFELFSFDKKTLQIERENFERKCRKYYRNSNTNITKKFISNSYGLSLTEEYKIKSD